MFKAINWEDYELLDCSDGERLERWGKYTLVRPDPQVIWKTEKRNRLWKKADGTYRRSKTGGGEWSINGLPDSWNISYKPLGLTFEVKAMGFKHTGVFPEQAVNWEWTSNIISEHKKNTGETPKILNLFAYTGGATIACAKAGAAVCHVDASKGIVQMAKQNAKLSGLGEAPIRYIVDDCKKFIEREIRRGNTYDGVIMDPPSYGRGPSGEIWKLEDSIYDFITLTSKVLSDKPLFFLINSYTTGLSPSVMGYMLSSVLCEKYGGSVSSDEIGLPVKDSGLYLPCGSTSRWKSGNNK